ncbi:hypothetical protein BVC93_08985 [Mycobacterium sp. MS1601]|uniref:hypothetical protein n=1 Tax=Mycobacterium sp. MS1601 TaxID=1936029 RepID=UPI0009794BD5|nr:hypothetical protein [Mycobacterium sp. MS1601]AQA02544.1 hypothetical protein BVC93_08985 [Mycobacterium sp. MS1601]
MTQQMQHDIIELPEQAPASTPADKSGVGEVFLVVLLWLLVAVATGLYLGELHRVDMDAMNGYGLISVLPAATLAGLGLLVVSFFGALSLPRQRFSILATHLVLMVFMVHGITALLESEPRFPITWVHLGFMEFIDRTGTTAPGLDTRWSWPGFFALATLWAGSGDPASFSPVLLLVPVFNNLLYLAALGLLMSSLRISWQAKWLAALLFCLLNWVGQDYFSPQGWTLLLYLLFLGFLMAWFRPPVATAPDSRLRPRWMRRIWQWFWRGTVPGELPPGAAGAAEKTVVFAVLVGVFITTTISHQLTPFAMIIGVAGLVIARRCELKGLPALLVVLLLAWISYMTQAYWGANLGEVMGGVGDVSGTVTSSVADRAALGDPGHQFVVQVRMVTTVLVFLVAAWGLLRRRRRGFEDRVLLVLTAGPVGLAFMQSYGGEIALRVYLFALAPLSVLVALAFFPSSQARPSFLAQCAACLCALVVLGAFLVSRYGNEAFERMPSGSVSAVQALYENSQGNVTVVYVTAVPDLGSTPFMPLGYRDAERVRWRNTMAPADPAEVSGVVEKLREQGPGSYLVTTRSQEDMVVFGQGYPAGWGEQFRHALASVPDMHVVYQNSDATVYSLAWPAGAEPNRFAPLETGVQIWRTPWTPLGVALLVMLVALLVTQEVRRLFLSPAQRYRLRPMTLAVVPLLGGFVLVVIERFVLLTS